MCQWVNESIVLNQWVSKPMSQRTNGSVGPRIIGSVGAASQRIKGLGVGESTGLRVNASFGQRGVIESAINWISESMIY